MRKSLLPALFILLFTVSVNAQHMALRFAIDRIARAQHGRVGVAINLLENDDSLTYHNNERYVLHSVFKLAIAMKMLREVDKGHFKLDQQIHISKADLPDTSSYSPLRDKYPNGDVDVPLELLITYMVSQSDNLACDKLLKLLGGTAPVEDFLQTMGVGPISIKVSEAQMAAAWPAQYSNWCQPYTQIELLRIIYRHSLLSPASNNYLSRILLATSTGPRRLKGLLPQGTPVAHKTGTSPTNAQGLSPATNDVGIIILPNGRHLAIAVFITDSTDPLVTRELVIAKIARAAHDEFVK
jgi:beta-lactamase class A